MGYILGRKPEHENLCFPCKVAAAGEKRWPRLCGGCCWGRFMRELFLLCVLQRVVCSCVRSSMRFLNLWLHDRIGMAAWMLHGICLGEEAGARNLVFFRVKWLQPAMKGTSSVRRVRLGSFHARIVPPMCFATSGCSCVRSSMRFLKLWLQIALEWLHECCMDYVLGRKPEHETLCFSV